MSTSTSSFGVGKRESHDASSFYARFTPPTLSDDTEIGEPPVLDSPCVLGDARKMGELNDNSVALVVTSPPYFVGKEYEDAIFQANKAASNTAADTHQPEGAITTRELPESYGDYLELLHDVFAECYRVLEPGGRIAINIANLGRKPYRSLSADIVRILEDLGMLLRGEILWQKGRGSSGSCAWGSFMSPANPVLRDTTERIIVASKGRFDRAHTSAERRKLNLPWRPTITNDEFLSATVDVWELPAESARRVNHPAPFPVELPLKLIELYTYEGDVVLDPFMGSGSTLVAAIESGRIPIGYDTDPDYVAAATDRLDTVELNARIGLDKSATEGRKKSDGAAIGVSGSIDAARAVLMDAGFNVVKGATKSSKAKIGNTSVSFPFLVEAADRSKFYVEVAGTATTSRPGLTRLDVVLRLLAHAHVLRCSIEEADGDPTPLITLTTAKPKPRSEHDKLLRSVGPEGLFDVIDFSSAEDLKRLASYAKGSKKAARPKPGFWTKDDVS